MNNNKCENCIHYDVCREWNTKFIDHRMKMGEGCVCKHFKDKSLFVEVVRCKDCTSWKNGICYCEGQKYTFTDAKHYCGFGERIKE